MLLSNAVGLCSARLFALCFLFILNCGILIEGEFIHSDGFDFTATGPASTHFDEELKNLKLAYEECLSELRKQAVSIKKLEDFSETQADTIKELQEVVSRQAIAVGKMEFILSHANKTDNYWEKPSPIEVPAGPRSGSIRTDNPSSTTPRSYGPALSSGRSTKRVRGKHKKNRDPKANGNLGADQTNKEIDSLSESHEGCILDLHANSPQYPAHLIDENNNIIYPTLQGKTRVITLSLDERITVGCLGSRNDKPSGSNILKVTGQQMNAAYCSINSTLVVNDQLELSYSQLGCANQNKEILKEDGTCADGRGILVRVGWQIGHDFSPLYDMCHDKSTTANYFSTHYIIGRSVDADDKANTRPSFRQAGYYPGLDVNAAFGQAQQNKTITRLVGSETLTAKYFNQKKNFFLARGHLAPDGDFIDAASQDASYYYLNMAPQWQSFNGGNWNILESAVRQIAITRDLDLTVYTGTFGTMTLVDFRGIHQPLYLAIDKNNNGVIPVPKYFWKLIYDPVSETATAVVGINNPHLDRVLPADILCPDVCSQIPWIKWKLTDISKGYMFCCTAQDLHKAISHAPDFNVPLFL